VVTVAPFPTSATIAKLEPSPDPSPISRLSPSSEKRSSTLFFAVRWFWFAISPTPAGQEQPAGGSLGENPVDTAADLKCPVLALYGGADQSIPQETVEKRQAACKAAGKTCEFKVYPDTPHGFNADYRPSYRAEAAKDGWARMLAWFKDHGVG